MRLLTLVLGTAAAQDIWPRITAENQLSAATSAEHPGNRLSIEGTAVEPVVCGEGEVHCTAEMVQKGANCVVGACTKQRCLHPWETNCQQDPTTTPVCAADEVLCSDLLVRQGMNCIVGACVKAPAPPSTTTVGRADEHGCVTGAGFSWCQGKQKCLRVWEEPCEDALPNGPVGGARDKHGCVTGGGYSWCETKKKCLRLWEEACGAEGTATGPFGGARDAHGCVTGGGYSWCDSKQKCLRRWEEKCEDSDFQPSNRPILQAIRERFGQFPQLAEILGNKISPTSEDRVTDVLKNMEDRRAALLTKLEDLKQKRAAWAQEHGVNLPADGTRVPMGGARDTHGCVTGGGYSWCEAKAKCLRAWEEACEEDKAAPPAGTESA